MYGEGAKRTQMSYSIWIIPGGFTGRGTKCKETRYRIEPQDRAESQSEDQLPPIAQRMDADPGRGGVVWRNFPLEKQWPWLRKKPGGEWSFGESIPPSHFSSSLQSPGELLPWPEPNGSQGAQEPWLIWSREVTSWSWSRWESQRLIWRGKSNFHRHRKEGGSWQQGWGDLTNETAPEFENEYNVNSNNNDNNSSIYWVLTTRYSSKDSTCMNCLILTTAQKSGPVHVPITGTERLTHLPMVAAS